MPLIDSRGTNGSSVDHGLLAGLADDDHTQYIRVDGTRAFTGVVVGVTPTLSTHLATKGYVDTLFSGLDWQESVLDRFDPTAAKPANPSIGDRYIATATANGWTINRIYECVTALTWTGQTEISPNEGYCCVVEDENKVYIYTGAAWVDLSAYIDLSGYQPLIAAGSTAQYWRGDKSWQTLNQAAVAGLTTSDSPTLAGLSLVNDSATTNTILDMLTIQRTTTGTAGAGIGAALKFLVEDASGNLEEAGRIDTAFDVALHATQTGRMSIRPFGATGEDGLHIVKNAAGVTNVSIGTTEPGAYKLNINGSINVVGDLIVGATGKFLATESTAFGEVPAGLYVSGNAENISFLVNGGTSGKKIGTYYYNQSAWYSAWEVANPASGYGNLLLMKSGGNVGINLINPPTNLFTSGTVGIGSYTDVSNYEYLLVTQSAGSIAVTVPTAGTGTDNVDVSVTPAGSGRFKYGTSEIATKDSVNPKATSQAVNMTAGVNPISIASNDNMSMGINDFTLDITVGLPDWTPATNVLLLQRYQDVGGENLAGYEWKISTDGYLRLTLFRIDGGAVYISTVPYSLTDGTTHNIIASVVRETASSAGSVTYYIDGVQIGASVVITQGTPGTMSGGTGTFYILGEPGANRVGIVSSAITYNRALTAAEVLDLYRNGPSFADKWGSQTSIITGNDSTFAGASNWANVNFNSYDETDDLSVTATAQWQYCQLPQVYAPMVYGKKYRLTFDAANIVGQFQIVDAGGNQVLVSAFTPLTGTNIFEFTITVGSVTGGFNFHAADSNSSGDFDNFLLYEIGATLALEPEGIKTPKWYDSSTNALDASYPTVGSSLTQDYQFGTESLLSITNVSFAGNGDTTLYTVPTGRRLILTKAIVIAGADAGATTALSIGADGTETDFVPAAVLSNLDAANDVVILQPVPVAALPAKNKSYAAGTVIQGQVATQSGGATNSVQLFGILY